MILKKKLELSLEIHLSLCCVFPTLQPFVFQKKVSQSIAFRFSMESQSPSSGADASPTSTLVAVYPLGKNLPVNFVEENQWKISGIIKSSLKIWRSLKLFFDFLFFSTWFLSFKYIHQDGWSSWSLDPSFVQKLWLGTSMCHSGGPESAGTTCLPPSRDEGWEPCVWFRTPEGCRNGVDCYRSWLLDHFCDMMKQKSGGFHGLYIGDCYRLLLCHCRIPSHCRIPLLTNQ